MKEEPLVSLTLDELKKREKMLKMSISLMLASVIVLTIAGAFLFYKHGFSGFTVLPIIFFSIVIINNVNLKKVSAEIERREK